MSVAVPIEAGDISSRFIPGVVAVLDYGFAHSAAMCSCGWTGRRRYLRAAANMDAWEHSLHEKCDVSVPLVIPVIASRSLSGQDLGQHRGLDVAS
jgi:hypothetical protein